MYVDDEGFLRRVVPAVLLSVHSTGKGGRLGSAALHTNVGSLPGVSSPRAIHDLQLPWK